MQNKSNNNKKKTKYKIKPVPVAILCASIVLIIVGIVALVSGGSDEDKPTVDIKPVGSQAQTVAGTAQETVKVSVKIGMGDCIVTTDQVVKVTATVEPSNTDTAVIWKSSDESVMTVDNEGVIRAKKAGVAALTATVGNVTDAIVVKWVAPESPEAAPGQVNPHINGSSYSGSAGPNIVPLQPEKPSQSASQGNTQGATQGTTTAPTQGTTTAPTQGTTTAPTQGTTTKPTQGATTAPTQGATTPTQPAGALTGLKSTELYTVLPDLGFTRLYSNVYSFGASKDNYCGQVIIEPNQATIYIASRKPEFDNSVKSLLAYMLPANYNQIWSTYVSAGSDTTFTVADRKVRIVVAKSGGHSQIVIWN